MSVSKQEHAGRKADRIDIKHEYELCAWARHFNTSEWQVKEAVAAVGDEAERVRDHLSTRRPSRGNSERPTSG